MSRKMRIVLIVGCIFWGLIICVVMYGLLGKNRLTAQTYDDQNVGEIYFEPTEEEHITITNDGSVMYANNELLVVAKLGVSKRSVEKLAKEYEAEIVGYIEQTGDYQWRFGNIKTEEEMRDVAKSVKQSDLIDDAYMNYVEDYLETAETVKNGSRWMGDLADPNDIAGKSWGVEAIKAPAVWSYFNRHMTGIKPVKVGLVDSGFDMLHEDLQLTEDRVFYNTTLQNGLDKKKPVNIPRKHGTHVAGIMAAIGTNDEGINGVYPYGAGRLYGVSVIGMQCYDENMSYHLSMMMQKIAFAELIVRNVKVINQSMGFNWNEFFEPDGKGSYKYRSSYAESIRKRYDNSVDALFDGFKNNDSFSQLKKAEAMKFADFLNRTLGLGYDFVIINAAGNAYGRDAEYNSYNSLVPKESRYQDVYDRIIVVGSISRQSSEDSESLRSPSGRYIVSDFSDTGDRVDIFAPGKDIYSTLPSKNNYGNDSGTSMAAPHVAGVCANVWSVNNKLTGKEVKEIVTGALLTGENNKPIYLYDKKGIVDCQKAVEEAVRRKNAGSTNKEVENTYGLIEGWVYEADSDGSVDKTMPVYDATIKAYDQNGKEVRVYNEKNGKAYFVKTDSKGHYEFFVSPGTYNIAAYKEGYSASEASRENGILVEREQVHYAKPLVLIDNSEPFIIPIDGIENGGADNTEGSNSNEDASVDITEQNGQEQEESVPEAENIRGNQLTPTLLESFSIVESDEYQDNEGDSFIYPIGQHQFTRGNQDINGIKYYHGLEAWIARWNNWDESSWAYSVFSIPTNYNTLTGQVVLIDSYNTTNFDSTLYFYDEDRNLELGQYRLTPSSIPLKFTVSISGVTNLKIMVSDNKAVSGGTSFGLVDCEETINSADFLYYNDHSYYVFSPQTASTWEEARDYCEQKQGHLAVISSQEENQAIYNYIIEKGYQSAYFGLSDADSEGVWIWETNENNTFTYWNEGEPNQESSGEDYAEFYWKYTDGQWNDGDFSAGNTVSDSNAFICEWDYNIYEYAIDSSKSGIDEESQDVSGDGYLYDVTALPDSMPAYPSTGQKYWIIFNEGFRNERLEMSTFDVSGDGSDTKIVWDGNLIGYSSTGVVSSCNQYVYTKNEWVEIGNYSVLSDLSHRVLAANVDVYDVNGKRIISASDYSTIAKK